MSNIAIGPGTQVTLHFAVKLDDGAVVDSTFDKQPASFTYGDGSLLKGFEDKLIGMTAGAKGSYTVSPEDGFGQPNPNNIQQFARCDFAGDITLEEGVVINFSDAGQTELPGVVKSVSADTVEVDFNHPLAGRNILFDVQIIDVKTL